MDTSEIYYNMCKQSITDLVTPDYIWRIGSLFWKEERALFPIAWSGKWDFQKFGRAVIPCWQQDQLQEMVDLSTGDKLLRVNRFYIESDYDHTISMEQLWLAFVMYELYQKKWDSEIWIKEDK